MNKKILAALCLLLSLYTGLNAQGISIDPSVIPDNPIFIKGAEGFNNVLKVSAADAPDGTVTVYFCSYNADGDKLDSTVSENDGTDWVDTVDMGALDEDATYIEAHFYDADEDLLDISDPYSFTLNPEPVSVTSNWVKIEVNSMNADGTAFLEFIIEVPDSVEPVDGLIIGIGGKSFGLNQNSIVLPREYDLTTGDLSGSGCSYQYQLNAFGEPVAAGEIPLDENPDLSITIDADYNPAIAGHFTAQKEFFTFETPESTLPLPISPASVSVGASLAVSGGLAVDCYVGIDQGTGNFGFIQDQDGSRSAFSIGAKMSGEVHITGSLLDEHLAGIRGTLTATGRIGASYEFQTLPEWQDTFLFGGDLLIKGSVELTGITGWTKKLLCAHSGGLCAPTDQLIDGVIWPRNNNDQPMSFGAGLPASLDSLLHVYLRSHNPYAKSLDDNDSSAAFPLPGANPQPSFANRGSAVATVWIESDSLNQHLLFSMLDTIHNTFIQSVEVANNGVMLADPKTAIAPDGSAIIVWSQNKLQASDIENDPSFDLTELLNNLEVWYAVYDPVTASITAKNRIDNPISLPASKPSVTISDSGKCIISWLAQDSGATTTDIWYAELVNSNSIWYQSTPDIINDLPGNNYSVNICFTDSVNAIATWITDPDADDSSGGNMIVACYYDGTGWGNTNVISDENDNEQFHDLSMDFNGSYGALAYTSTIYDEEGGQLNNIKVQFFKNGIWDQANEYEYADSEKYVSMPRVSISDLQFAAVSYQTVDMYSDSDGTVDAGEVNLTLKDLNSSNDWQALNFSIDIAQDTTIYIWDMDVVLGRNNTLYSLSQEEDTINYSGVGGHYNPQTGILFGDPSLSMVLRSLKINDDLSVTGDSANTLPETPTGIKQIAASSSQLNLLAYPNPFKNNLTIEYSVPESGNTKLEVFDMLGRSMAIPVNQLLSQGSYKTTFQSEGLSTGIYILKLTAGNSSKTSKLVKQ